MAECGDKFSSQVEYNNWKASSIPIAERKKQSVPRPRCSLSASHLLSWKARLPADQLQKCWRRKVTLMELQSLLGLLNFTCSVILLRHAFLHRMINHTKGGCRPHHHIHLTKEMKSGIIVWLTFLEQFNNQAFFMEEKWLINPSLELDTYTAGSKGLWHNLWKKMVKWLVARLVEINEYHIFRAVSHSNCTTCLGVTHD